MKFRPLLVILTASIAVMCGYGCGERNQNFVEIIEFNDRAWQVDQKARFTRMINDNNNEYDIGLIVRRTNRFKFENVKLEIKTISPALKYYSDTVVIDVKESKSKKNTPHKDFAVNYRRNVKFNVPGIYKFEIKQLNATDSLSGIVALGLTIDMAKLK